MASGGNKDGEFVDVRALSRNAPSGLSLGRASNISTGRIYYTKGVVAEYISNPASYLTNTYKDADSSEEKTVADVITTKSSEDVNKKIIDNPQVARYMPANSVIVYVDKNSKPVVAYPFFPPHISLPLKPGEQVWVLVEEKGENNEFYYWMSRVATDGQVDDLNYTNIDRTDAIRELSDEYDTNGNVTSEELIGLSMSSEMLDNSKVPNGISTSQIHAQSVAYRGECILEPVPRTFGKSSDLILQGSNNSTIQFTTEKFRENEEIASKEFLGSEGNPDGLSLHTPRCGTIDMFVGKEKERLKELAEASDPEALSTPGKFNVRLSKRLTGNQDFETYEASKIDEYTLGEENEFEGDDAPRNVHSRIYLGMNSTPDQSFEFLNEDFSEGPDEYGNDRFATGASAVLYSDHIRSFAEKSLRLHVFPPDAANGEGSSVSNSGTPGGALLDIATDGTITLQSGQGDKAAKIVLRSDGNIIIKPGENGVLHLGGEIGESSSVAVGVQNLNPASHSTGTTTPIDPAPATTTMGGQGFLGDAMPATGYTSSKVLIKI